MSEFILFLVIVALCGLVGWLEWNNRKERAKFLNAVLAKDAQEMVGLDLADKAEIDKVKADEQPDLVHESELSNEEFMKLHGIEPNEV